MKDHAVCLQFLVDPYDRYRDLNLVWENELCAGRFNKENTLLIDSDDTKVQLFLENSITNSPYSQNDI